MTRCAYRDQPCPRPRACADIAERSLVTDLPCEREHIARFRADQRARMAANVVVLHGDESHARFMRWVADLSDADVDAIFFTPARDRHGASVRHPRVR